MINLEELKQAYKDADQEYQFALASGDRPRLQKALADRRKAYSAYSKAKKKAMQ